MNNVLRIYSYRYSMMFILINYSINFYLSLYKKKCMNKDKLLLRVFFSLNLIKNINFY